jgi:hypothetical protein
LYYQQTERGIVLDPVNENPGELPVGNLNA